MPRPRTTRPPADGGYPLDSDLHRMTDDGGPHTPNPARWSDPDWRDNLGVWDTFGPEASPAPARPAPGGAGWLGRWGLAAGGVLLLAAAAAAAAALRGADGAASWAVGSAAALLLYAAVMCVHCFDRMSPAY